MSKLSDRVEAYIKEQNLPLHPSKREWLAKRDEEFQWKWIRNPSVTSWIDGYIQSLLTGLQRGNGSQAAATTTETKEPEPIESDSDSDDIFGGGLFG